MERDHGEGEATTVGGNGDENADGSTSLLDLPWVPCIYFSFSLFVCVCVHTCVVCECFLDLCEYENLVWIDWLKNGHTKRKMCS